MNLLSSLNISAGALSVNEKAISVVSHNVSNMNTEGYHKQRANLQARNIAGQIGDNPDNQVRANGGVKIANIMRYNDDYLNNYYRDQLSKKNMLEQQLGNLQDLAKVFDDLDGTGIDAALSDFYEALNNLNEYPASSSARANFIETSKTLTNMLNSKSEQLKGLTGDALGDGTSAEALESSRINAQYKALNTSLEELAQVNKALQTTQTGTLTANNLLDQRDLILSDIAQYVDITVDEKPNGSVNVYTGNVSLVKGSVVTGSLGIMTKAEFQKQYPDMPEPTEAAVVSILNEKGEVIVPNANGDITGGALGGLIHSGTDIEDDGTINPVSVQNSLNTLASAIANIFNDLNTNSKAFCIDPSNTSHLKETNENNKIFVGGASGEEDVTAANIRLADNLLTADGIWNLSCAYFDDLSDYDINAVGNSNNVQKMLGTRNQKQDALNGMSVEDYYSSLVGKIAAAGGSAQTQYETQSDVVDSINNQLDSAYGVDLNEELVDLVKYQTAYAAAAQVFNVVNSCLDTLMSLGR